MPTVFASIAEAKAAVGKKHGVDPTTFTAMGAPPTPTEMALIDSLPPKISALIASAVKQQQGFRFIKVEDIQAPAIATGGGLTKAPEKYRREIQIVIVPCPGGGWHCWEGNTCY
ncbi:MAG: hypothetical protein WC268_04305 [Patescibacteria group bacterium]|jgi:hypothetical protein